MWDLLRSGYRDAYLNVRMVESMHSLLELQDAGLVPRQVLTNEDLAKTKGCLHFAKQVLKSEQ